MPRVVPQNSPGVLLPGCRFGLTVNLPTARLQAGISLSLPRYGKHLTGTRALLRHQLRGLFTPKYV